MFGTSRYPGPDNFGAVRYDDAGRQVTNLGALGGDRASALGINDAGHVVGYMSDSLQSNERAFVYTGGRLYDLNGVADLPAGWTLRQAYDVNELGQIVGWGTNAAGRHTAFVLTPVPEPAVMGLAVAATALLARRRGRASGCR